MAFLKRATPAPVAQDVPPPRHVGVIMDGNGRWAKARGLPRSAGHRAGVEAVRRCVRAAMGEGVRFLTLFGFSTENWRRPRHEVDDLFDIMRHYVKGDLNDLRREGVRVRIVGEREGLAADIRDLIERAEAAAPEEVRLDLTIAFNYGGRAELVAAARAAMRQAAAGALDPDGFDEAAFEALLETAETPDVDLVIRTSGERRISNFLLWRAAYAELVFQDVLWPDYGAADFRAAIDDFRGRRRRFGGVEARASA